MSKRPRIRVVTDVKPKKKENQVATRGYVKRVVKGIAEMKYHDNDVSDTSLGYDAFYVRNLTNIARGDASNNREGDELTPMKLDIRYRLPARASNHQVRVMVVQWLEDEVNNALTAAKILENSNNTNGVISHPVTTGDKKNFRILYDRVIAVPSTSGDGKAHIAHVIIPSKKMIKVHYADAALKKGQIFMLATTETIDSATSATFGFQARLYFKDF